jgi:hypothetical protein
MQLFDFLKPKKKAPKELPKKLIESGKYIF